MAAQEPRSSICRKDVSDSTYKDVFEKVQPTTHDGECLLECMLRISGLVRTAYFHNTQQNVNVSIHCKAIERWTC